MSKMDQKTTNLTKLIANRKVNRSEEFEFKFKITVLGTFLNQSTN